MKIVILIGFTSAALLEASRTIVGVGGKGEGSLANELDEGVVLKQIMDYNKVLLEQVSTLKQQLADLKDDEEARGASDQENDLEENDLEENGVEEESFVSLATTATSTMHAIIMYPLKECAHRGCKGLLASSAQFRTTSALTSSIMTTIKANDFFSTSNCQASVQELCAPGNRNGACHKLVEPFSPDDTVTGGVKAFAVRCATITCTETAFIGGSAEETALKRFQEFQSVFSDKLLRDLPAGSPFVIKVAHQCANMQQAQAAFGQ